MLIVQRLTVPCGFFKPLEIRRDCTYPMQGRKIVEALMMDQPLGGKNVVITGGTGMLGGAVVARIAAAGATCHVPSRRSDAAGPDAGVDGRVRIVPGIDLTDETAVDRFYDAIPELWASVHLAGGFAMAPIQDTTQADVLHMVEMNTLTAFVCCRAAARNMRRLGHGGRIVNVTARPGLEPRKGAGMAAYAASKAAVLALTLALAEELKEDRILVNAIAPSIIDTPANRKAMPDSNTSKWLSPEAAAEAILQLVSPANLEISGAVLPLYAEA